MGPLKVLRPGASAAVDRSDEPRIAQASGRPTHRGHWTVMSRCLIEPNRMVGRLGFWCEVAPRHCAARRSDYDNAPRRGFAVEDRYIRPRQTGGRLCRSLRCLGSSILLSTVWGAGSPSLWWKRLHQTSGLTHSHRSGARSIKLYAILLLLIRYFRLFAAKFRRLNRMAAAT